MTKKEFMEKFGDGKTKITRNHWLKKAWVIPSTFATDNFAGITENDCIFDDLYNYAWQLYQEPKPEFNFDKPYMWVKDKEETWLLVKTSFMTWIMIDADGDWIAHRQKRHFQEQYEPTAQPDNWRDYGLEEGDL